ncbi:hypothetical protein ACLB0R_09485 [Sphingomonas sp. GlSt437]|uniref:hypothetical protein n=1 Tax=Sphingomonas sp. GlSt437 TaxID=3389970 RepID=UPI003A878108
MQTERVTFLTSRDHKAALDAFARRNGKSVGHVVREATSLYMAAPTGAGETELAALVDEVNAALPRMEASLDEMSATLRETHADVDRMLREMGAR